jgi:hypothetical protein
MFMAVLICAVTSLLTCTGHPSKTPISHWNSPSAVDRKSREGEIKLVPVEEKRETAFGARMPVRFEGLIGRELDEFLETDLLDRLQRSNISVMFQAGAERDGNRIVTGVFPDVFYSGCVVVVVTSGRMPHN